jgi:hypothetical protein
MSKKVEGLMTRESRSGDDDARERLVGLVFSCLVGRERRGRGARSREEGT